MFKMRLSDFVCGNGRNKSDQPDMTGTCAAALGDSGAAVRPDLGGLSIMKCSMWALMRPMHTPRMVLGSPSSGKVPSISNS